MDSGKRSVFSNSEMKLKKRIIIRFQHFYPRDQSDGKRGKGYWKDIILGRKDGGAARWNIFIEFNELESLASTRINEDAAKDVLPMLYVVCLFSGSVSRMKLKRMCSSHFFPFT